MITYCRGSIFQSQAQTLVNPVNTEGVMGKGLALAFAKRFPIMLAEYKIQCQLARLDVGELLLHRDQTPWIISFPTKATWRGKSRLSWIDQGLQTFAEAYQEWGITSVAFPALGCGLGGLEWEAVQPLMAGHLHDLPLPVEIWLYTA